MASADPQGARERSYRDNTVASTYDISEDQREEIQKKLEAIVARMRRPGDPPFTIAYLPDRHFIAEVRTRREAGVTFSADIDISRGTLEALQNEDQLAWLIAHEMSHAIARPIVTDKERDLQSQLEELRIADVGAFDRVIQGGYNPVAGREMFIEWIREGKEDHRYRGVVNAASSHPPHQIRITNVDVELKLRHDKAEFPPPVGDPAGWMEKFKRAFKAPWSLAENKPGNLATLLERIQKVPAFQRMSVSMRVRTIAQLFAERDLGDVRSVLVNGTLLDPDFNPGPFLDALVFHPEYGTFGLSGLHRPSVLKNDEVVKFEAKDIETFLKWAKQESRKTQSPEELGSITQVLNWLANEKKRPSVKVPFLFKGPMPQRTWQLRPERMHVLQNEIRPLSSLGDNLQALLDGKATYSPEQKLEMLLRHAERGALPLVYTKALMDALHEVNPKFWTVDQAKRYGRLIPQLQRQVLGDLSAVPSRHWPGFDRPWGKEKGEYSDHTEGYGWASKRREFLTAASRLHADTVRYVQRSITDPSLPLGLRMATVINALPVIRDYNDEEKKKHNWSTNKKLLGTVKDVEDLLRGAKEAKEKYGISWYEVAEQDLFQAILDHPEWKMTSKDLVGVLNEYKFDWLEHTYKAQPGFLRSVGLDPQDEKVKALGDSMRSAATAENAAKAAGLAGEKGLEASILSADKKLRNASYKFDLKESERIQRTLWERLKKQGQIPKDPSALADVHQALAKIGNTQFTDELAEQVYLKAEQSPVALKKALDEGSIWDFAVRKRVFDRLAAANTAPIGKEPTERKQQLELFVKQVNEWFPEPSRERSEIIEEYSNHIRSNYAEAKQLEAAKLDKDANQESVALRIFSSIFGDMSGTKQDQSRPNAFVHFLVGNGPFPDVPDLVLLDEDGKEKKDAVGKIIRVPSPTKMLFGPTRTKRLFDSLPPELKAVAIAPFLAEPHGVLTKPKYKEKIFQTILAAVDPKHRKDARLLLDALLHAQRKVAPFEENLTIAYLFAQAGNKDRKGGQVYREILESQGAPGIALGQKLYQRRMGPAEYLEDIADLQDDANRPTRLEAIERAIEVLDLKNPDAEVAFDQILGSASAKVVMAIHHREGEEAAKRMALKMLRKNFDRRLNLDDQKLNAAMEYLDKHGGDRYRGLNSVVDASMSALRRQSDLRSEAKNEDAVKRLYGHGTVDKHGVRWLVSENARKLSSSKDHSQEPAISGQTVKSLSEEYLPRFAASIFDKDYEILLSEKVNAKPEDEIEFEQDRHMGNYMVDLKKNPPEIYVIDFPLLTSIRVDDRANLFKLIGLIELARLSGGPSADVRRQMKEILVSLSAPGTADAKQMERAVTELFKRKSGYSEPATRALTLFSLAEKKGAKIKSSAYSYLTALGHLDGIAKHSGSDSRMQAFHERTISIAKTQLTDTVDRMSWLEKCAVAARQLLLRK